jgi:hypothetical protein
VFEYAVRQTHQAHFSASGRSAPLKQNQAEKNTVRAEIYL